MGKVPPEPPVFLFYKAEGLPPKTLPGHPQLNQTPEGQSHPHTPPGVTRFMLGRPG